MKFLYLALITIFLTSCSSFTGERKLASVEEYRVQEIYQVGEVKVSLLEPTDFRDKYGSVWVLMDGRSASNTDFASLTGLNNVPDARGKFLRMLNVGASGAQYDPNSKRAPGSYQGDMLGSHNHSYSDQWGARGGHGQPIHMGTTAPQTRHESTGHTGGEETRPKNIAVYYYIKLNSCSSEESVCL